ncbi:MAG: hypothetical protein V3T31_11060 [candidate division Zixibacteria bacterium]
MKKLITITLCLILVMSAASFATKTRTLTMGDNNGILLDEANIWMYPARINDYPDIAVGEFSAGDYEGEKYDGDDDYFSEFGIHWKFGSDNPWILGTYLYNSQGEFGDDAYLNAILWPVGLASHADDVEPFGSSQWGFPDTDYSNKRISLFYGRKLGGYNFGFAFHKLHSSYRAENDDGNNYMDQSFSRYNFSLGLTEGMGNWDLALHVQMQTWRDKQLIDDAGTWSELDKTKPAGNTFFQLMGRYFPAPINPSLRLVPHVSLSFGKFETEDYYDGSGSSPTDYWLTPNTEKMTAFIVDLGSGLHYTPAAGMLAVMDFGVSYAKLTNEWADLEANGSGTSSGFDETGEDKYTMWTLPYMKIGFEGEVLKWLKVRMGATTYWRSLSEEWSFTEDGAAVDYDPDEPVKWVERWPANKTYLGLEFNWGNLTIDTWTDPDLFLHGFNFISGEREDDGDGRMNAGLSAIYSF